MERRSLSESGSDEAIGGDTSLAPSTGSSHAARTDLRAFTPARISLARTGVSMTTRDTLAFALDHAQARDAVHAPMNVPGLLSKLEARGLGAIAVKSAVPDRSTYLRRPDLGRTLSPESRATLESLPTKPTAQGESRLAIILADGLSAFATERHAVAVIDALLPLLPDEWTVAPLVVAEQARVALGDEIGAALGAHATVMLIGERPGLSAADSLGAYITWAPRIGRTNAERNCISNIRAEGLAPLAAGERIAYYLREAKRLGMTGTMLKDPQTSLALLDR
jgi:ethanolamine ammonia-lyase small subunit